MRFTKLKIKPPPINIPQGVYISTTAVLGTLTGLVLSKNFALTFVIGSALVISISIIGMSLRPQSQKTTLLFIAMFGLFFSRTLYVTNTTPPPWVVLGNGDLVEVQGVVVSNPSTKPRTEGYLSNIDDRPPVTSFDIFASPPTRPLERTMLTIEVDGETHVNKGDEIITIGRIRRHLFADNKPPTIFVQQRSLVKAIHKNTNTYFEAEQIIKQRIVGGMQGEEKTLVSALFFGEREVGWRELTTTFRIAGLAHILAVSGLHIAIVLIAIIWIVRVASLGKVLSFIIVCAISIFLLSLIESRPPVFRAILMVVIASTLQCRGQRFSGSGILAVVAMIFMWIDPAVIKTIGFILSFTVVFGLCVLLPTMQWKLLGPRDNYSPMSETIRYTMSSLWVVGFCAVLIAAPLVMHFFGTVAPIGLLSSIGGIFFLVAVLFLGLFRLAVGWVHPFIDEQLLWCMKHLSSQMIETVKQYGDLPLFFRVHPPDMLFVVLLLLFLCFVIITTGRVKIKITIGMLLAVSLLGTFQNNNVVISTLNVGHGTSHIIQDGTTTVLVDAGSRADLDIGLHKVLPSLRKLGITKINTLVVTHNDLDHCSAILDLIHEIEIVEICMTPYALAHQTKVIGKIVQVAKAKQIEVNEITKGWGVRTDNTTITAMWPEKGADYTSSNEASVVLSIKSNGRSVLLTGDINEKTISTFLSQPMDNVDVLEMPHHGQWSTESAALLHKLQPSVVIQSTSKSRFARDEWIIQPNTERLVTCVDGDITTTIKKDGQVEINTSYTKLNLAP